MTETIMQPGVKALWDEVESRVNAGDRFSGLFGTRLAPADPLTLSVHVTTADGVDTLEATLPAGAWYQPGSR